MASAVLAPPAAPAAPERRSARRASFLRVLFRSRLTGLGALLVVAFVLMALLGPGLSGYDPNAPVLADRLQGPSPVHILGTDDTGRDIATRIAYGAQISLFMGFVAMLIPFMIGVPLGLLAGYLGGRWDFTIMRVVDILLTLPSIVLALSIVTVLGAGLRDALDPRLRALAR